MNFKELEAKWREVWMSKPDLYRAYDSEEEFEKAKGFKSKGKKYVLVEFPYPSGAGLHVGHAFSYTACDVYARFKRMQGYNVLSPMGWDAFGLPTENHAIKTKQKPQDVTIKNTDSFRTEMNRLAMSFDWSRELFTTDPAYYQWTQWIFIKLWEQGLAHKEKMPINWCPSCKIGLANEEVVDGKCERCGTPVEKREIEQWVVSITKYADRLLKGLEKTEFIDKVKASQINWIGKKEGAKIQFKLSSHSTDNLNYIEVFTTRPDTIYGVSAVVVAPEHELVSQIDNADVKNYLESVKNKSDLERTDLNKDKSGVFTGMYVKHPLTGDAVPVWVADYVLSTFGTGAVMVVPAHDSRDMEFAIKHSLEIKYVVENPKASAFSYVMGLDKNAMGELNKFGDVIGIADKDSKGLIFDKSQNKEYENFISDNLLPGFWNEYFNGSEFVFVFKHKDSLIEKLVLNKENKKRILELAVEFTANDTIGNGSVWRMLYENDFYKHQMLYEGEGVAINSPLIDGLSTTQAQEKIIAYLEKQKLGSRETTYHLRDWIFSRQHYWGEPMPMYKPAISEGLAGQSGEWKAVPLEELPVVLPEVEHYEPSSDGRSPLANIKEYWDYTNSLTGEKGVRDTDTMPNWAGSDWYFIGYLLPEVSARVGLTQKKAGDTPSLQKTVFEKNMDRLKYWLPVDVYIGGDEHNTLHLLYSRFIHQFLFDMGQVPCEEPYAKRVSHGVILGPDGQRMSKSKGNVIVPGDVAEKYGVDVLRTYMMFMGPFDATMAWDEKTLVGVKRFVERFEKLVVTTSPHSSEKETPGKISSLLNKTLIDIERDLEQFKFNTPVAKLMGLLNELEGEHGKGDLCISATDWGRLIATLAPYAPYLAEELWQQLGISSESVHNTPWPTGDSTKVYLDILTVPVCINGKVKFQVEIQAEELQDQAKILEKVEALEKYKELLGAMSIRRVVYIPGKMLNFVV